MLITRICDPEYSPWQLHKYSSSPRRHESPRMSDRYDLPIPVQPDWQGQYQCLPPHDTDGGFPRPFGDGRHVADEPRRPHPTAEGALAALDGRLKRERAAEEGGPLRCSADSLGPGGGGLKRASPAGEERSLCPDKMARGGSCPVGGCFPRPSGPNHLHMVLASEAEAAADPRQGRPHDEDAKDGDDGEIEADDDDAAADGDAASRPQTVEERLAARRKMEERDADVRIEAFNKRLQDMIRQGKEALGTTVEVNGGDGGWEDDDDDDDDDDDN
ncbi:hypothetical protein CDD83_10132 [Cordyceps sp. RAO-2017]|nr:hypothetical protein CDD83_10132 [Cordyceps sp. RAO-2017]